MDGLIHIDQQLLFWLNQDCAHPLLDRVVPVWRDKYTWIPLYLILAAGILWRYRWKGLLYIALLLLTVGFTDFTSSSIIKPLVGRLRPCNTPELTSQLRILIACGGGKSFTSSHAANHMGLTVLFSLLFARGRPWIWWVAIGWAASIALGQVYIAAHYPSDIIAGGLLGAGIAVLVYKVARLTDRKRTFVPL